MDAKTGLDAERRRRRRWGMLLALLVLCVYRTSLLDSGTLFFWDEFRYERSLDAAAFLADGELGKACGEIHKGAGRPGGVLLYCLPALGQQALRAATDEPLLSPRSLRIATRFNLLVSLLITVVFYKLSVLLLGSAGWAALAAGVHAAAVNTNLYLCHLLPCDLAMLVGLTSVYGALRWVGGRGAKPWARTYALLGASSCFAYVVYPGYYQFVPLAAGVLAAYGRRGLKARALGLVVFGLGALAPLLIMEAIARFGGTGYLSDSQGVGYLLEFWTGEMQDPLSLEFFPIYVTTVEGPLGIALLGLAAGSAALLVTGWGRRCWVAGRLLAPAPLTAFALICVGAYCAHSLAVHFERLQFYGRFVHVYYPALVLLSVDALRRIESRKTRRLATLLVASLATWGALSFVVERARYASPRDLLLDQGIDMRQVPGERLIAETSRLSFVGAPTAEVLAVTRGVRADQKNLILVNMCFPWPKPGETQRFSPPPGARLLTSRLHLTGFTPYLFEGYDPAERAFLAARELRISIYAYPVAR